jgi:hypothetical protein
MKIQIHLFFGRFLFVRVLVHIHERLIMLVVLLVSPLVPLVIVIPLVGLVQGAIGKRIDYPLTHEG